MQLYTRPQASSGLAVHGLLEHGSVQHADPRRPHLHPGRAKNNITHKGCPTLLWTGPAGLAPAPLSCLFLQVIGYLQVHVYLEGARFSLEVARTSYLPGLQAGWLVPGGSAVDLSDDQWREFRGSLGSLAAALLGFALLARSVGTMPACLCWLGVPYARQVTRT